MAEPVNFAVTMGNVTGFWFLGFVFGFFWLGEREKKGGFRNCFQDFGHFVLEMILIEVEP